MMIAVDPTRLLLVTAPNEKQWDFQLALGPLVTLEQQIQSTCFYACEDGVAFLKAVDAARRLGLTIEEVIPDGYIQKFRFLGGCAAESWGAKHGWRVL